ncbi:hypothetical protein [Christiangramia forsetii]|nr:hypothetical protein [Christiangramia forsetii]
MSFRDVDSATINRDNDRQISTSLNIENQDSENGFRKILQKGRLTEDDLENFRQNILKAHKKKHYRTLLITAVLLIFIGILLYFLTI